MRPLDDRVRALGAANNGIVTVRELAPMGIDRGHLRDDVTVGRLVRVHPGVFAVPGDDGISPMQRLRAALAHLGPDATLGVGSAGRLLGVWGLSRRRVPEVALPPGQEKRQRAGLAIRFWDLPPDQVTVVDGLRTTTPQRTVADLARELPRAVAVACVDSALHHGLISVDDLPAIAEMMNRKRGCVAGRRHLLESAVGAQSPPETHARLAFADAGFAPDALQVPVRDAHGRILGYGDLGWQLPDGTWLVAEIDGLRYHDVPSALLYDRHRQNAFVAAADVQVVRFVPADLRSPDYVIGTIRPILARAGWRPPNARRP